MLKLVSPHGTFFPDHHQHSQYLFYATFSRHRSEFQSMRQNLQELVVWRFSSNVQKSSIQEVFEADDFFFVALTLSQSSLCLGYVTASGYPR